jgi:hypothetical protein
MHIYEMDTPDAEAIFRRMTPTTEERQIGGKSCSLWKQCAVQEQLEINYVNTFTRLGECVKN